MKENVLRVQDLKKTYREGTRLVEAVRGVSFDLYAGEITGIVGASGCGKSTLLQMIAGLETPSDGCISFLGQTLTAAQRGWPRDVYRHLQLIFQNPLEAFSPRMTVGQFLLEPLRRFGLVTDGEERSTLHMMLERAHLPSDTAERLPHQLSGGQLQRAVMIRALFVRPSLLLFDEPTSALDVVTQAALLDFIRELHSEYGFTGLFVTHDLAVVQKMTTRVLVMERGEIVEELPSTALKEAVHPFTRQLIAAQLPHDRV